MYVYHNTEVCLCNQLCSGNAISIIYSEYVLIAFSIQHAMHMHPTAICSLLGYIVFFHIIS